jgi:glycosyltransferase 2 family protein
MAPQPTPPKKSILGMLVRIAICGVLLVWIFQSIFWSEGKRAWEDSDSKPAWNELSRNQRLEISWQHGPRELWRNLSQVKGGPFAVSLAVMGATIFLSVIRWRWVLSVHGLNLSLGRAMEISIVAHFFNAFLLGATGGDLIKAWYAARETHHKKIEAVGTVFVDRIIGLFALLLFACVTMTFNLEFLKSDPTYRKLAIFVLVMSAGGFVATFLAFRGGMSMGFSKVREWIRRLPKGDTIEKLRDSFLVYRKHKRALFSTLLISLLIHFVAVLHVKTVAWGMASHVTFWQLLTIVPIISCFIVLPISPSGLGVRENLFVYMLISPLIADTEAQALALSLLCFAGSLFWSLIGGIVYATFKDRHHLDEITHESDPENGAPSAAAS